jgi:hypothetical protein
MYFGGRAHRKKDPRRTRRFHNVQRGSDGVFSPRDYGKRRNVTSVCPSTPGKLRQSPGSALIAFALSSRALQAAAIMLTIVTILLLSPP